MVMADLPTVSSFLMYWVALQVNNNFDNFVSYLLVLSIYIANAHSIKIISLH